MTPQPPQAFRSPSSISPSQSLSTPSQLVSSGVSVGTQPPVQTEQVPREVLTVPRDALVLRPEGQSIFIVDAENVAQKVPVTVGIGHGEHVEILGTVSPGDRVVIRGNERLQPGQPVSIPDS